jgi:hypothetical protein
LVALALVPLTEPEEIVGSTWAFAKLSLGGGGIQLDRQEAELMPLTITFRGCGPNPRVKFIPGFGGDKWQ